MAPAGAEDLSTRAPEQPVVDYELDQAPRGKQVSDEEDGKLQAQIVDGPSAVGEEPMGTGVMPPLGETSHW